MEQEHEQGMPLSFVTDDDLLMFDFMQTTSWLDEYMRHLDAVEDGRPGELGAELTAEDWAHGAGQAVDRLQRVIADVRWVARIYRAVGQPDA